ncbi:MAG TPA: ABC transporter permease [Vicinamibacteria bacterium]|nr:ABC transporter permease [Vicinamibacteria bacterium]
MDSFLQDFRYGLRGLLKAPGFAAIAALTLAIGLGANTAIFSVMDKVVLAPLPYGDPGTLVTLHNRWRGFDRTWLNPFEVRTYLERCPSLAGAAYWSVGFRNLTGDGEAVRVGAGFVSASTFDVLGARPVLGRVFTAEEDQPNGPRLVILSHALWQGRFAGDPDVIGRKVPVDAEPHEVIGVMGPAFALPTDLGEDAADPTQIWLPRAPEPEELTADAGGHGDDAAGRLRPGATVAQLNRELTALAAALAREYPDAYPEEVKFSGFALRIDDDLVGPYRPAVALLSGAVGLLLLISCANVANLLLARAESRQREIAVRLAIGAPRRRIARQLLTEGLILAAISAALGALLAHAGLRLLLGQGGLEIPRVAAAAVDARALLFSAALAVATTLIFALAPALHALRPRLSESLKEVGARTVGSASSRRWRDALVVAETALAVVLAVGAGLMARTLANLGRIDIGLDPVGVFTARVSVPAATYEKPESVAAFYESLLREVRALPGVKHAGLLRSLPLGQTIGDWGLAIEGREQDHPHGAQGDWQVATGGAAEAVGERLLQGRFLSDADVADAPQVAVINSAMARRYWRGVDPVGRRFRQGSSERPWLTVIGVVDDVRHNGLTGIVKPKFYRPAAQFHLSSGNPPRSMNLVVKTTQAEPMRLVAPVGAILRRLDPGVPLAAPRTMSDVVRASKATPRFAGHLLGLFAALALTLAAVGVYGVLSYAVSERTAEIGVRMALGARPDAVRRLVVSEGVARVAAGVGLGGLMAFGLARLMASLLFGVPPRDPATFASVAFVLVAVGLLAAWLPARRASSVDPMAALRHE